MAQPRTISTTIPPTEPPVIDCPACGGRLMYVRSFISGRAVCERWDVFECISRSCGHFEYRHRTRRVRRLPPQLPPSWWCV
jgi:hypothetical protein